LKESAIAGGIVRSPVIRTPQRSLQLLCVAVRPLEGHLEFFFFFGGGGGI